MTRKVKNNMNDEKILLMYKNGYTIDFIAKRYYKYKNKSSKPVVINGITLYPAKIYDLKYCRLYVVEVIYKYLINGDMAHTQTA